MPPKSVIFFHFAQNAEKLKKNGENRFARDKETTRSLRKMHTQSAQVFSSVLLLIRCLHQPRRQRGIALFAFTKSSCGQSHEFLMANSRQSERETE